MQSQLCSVLNELVEIEHGSRHTQTKGQPPCFCPAGRQASRVPAPVPMEWPVLGLCRNGSRQYRDLAFFARVREVIRIVRCGVLSFLLRGGVGCTTALQLAVVQEGGISVVWF